MGISGRENWGFYPEQIAYPWQVLETEGETWLIVRWREKVAQKPIQKVGSVVGEKFAWELTYDTAQKSFYSGEMVLRVDYETAEVPPLDLSVGQPWLAEYAFIENLGRVRKQLTFSGEVAPPYPPTRFPSYILEQINFSSPSGIVTKDKVWRVVLPWRCWLKGFGEKREPVLKKVHLAQVGLYTLLLEVLLKFEKKEKAEVEELPLSMEEVMLEMKEDTVAEVLGLVTEKAYPRCFYDQQQGHLVVSCWQRYFLIYLSAQKGGERILTATHSREEIMAIKNYKKSLYPMAIGMKTKEKQLRLLSPQKIYYCRHNFCYPQCDLAQYSGEGSPVQLNLGEREIGRVHQRKKPGEKWFKKKESETNCHYKKIISLKV